MNAQLFIDNLWRWKCGLPEEEIIIRGTNRLEDLKKSEWSSKFEDLMRRRLIFGAMRYGKISGKGKPKYDRISSIIKRLEKFKITGNKEHLVDVANLCLLEFVECSHPKAHFNSIDGGEHVNIE